MPTRDFTVAVFVVRNGTVLLHLHKRLGRWLPPGGHIELNELPDDAAIREVLEETGVRCILVGPSPNSVNEPGQPRQLVRPIGIQLADIGDTGHQHIDLVYLALGLDEGDGRGSWFTEGSMNELNLDSEVAAWCGYALKALSGKV